MKMTVNGVELDAEMSAYTLVLYEEEFDGVDMIADLNGKVRANEDEEGVLFDFASVPWKKIMQGSWAMLKTANEKIPHFSKWSKDIREVNMFELRGVLQEAMEDAFFHIAASDGGGDDEKPQEQ